MFRKAIISNRVVTPDGIKKAVVIIVDGKIREILDELPGGEFEVIDVDNKVLMAGVVDPHVHINEPGRTNWEGFDTATRSALAGGITTLVDMPLNSSPVTTSVKALEEKVNSTKGQLHVHCGFWGGVIPRNEKDIEPLIQNGVLGFKAFLTHSGIDEFPNVTEQDLRKVMPGIASHGLPLLVHCELSDSIQRTTGDNRSYQNYLGSRPHEWEDKAIALMIALCEEFNCRTHIVHLSSANSLKQIEQAKQKKLPLTVETAQHYLYFCSEEIEDGATVYKCAPPIREKENREQLWQALNSGLIDFVATDHSPAPPESKEIISGDFMKAWGGISSIQFALPILWTAARERGTSLSELSKWLCERPAALPNLRTKKGKIAKDYDADLIAWEPDNKLIVSESMILHRHKLTPYMGEELYGVVEQSWLKGECVYDSGKFLHLNKGCIIYNE